MYTLLLFFAITLIQIGFILWKRSELKDYQDIAKGVADVTTLSRRKFYNAAVNFTGKILVAFSKVLWVVIPTILLINLIISLIAVGLIQLIIKIF